MNFYDYKPEHFKAATFDPVNKRVFEPTLERGDAQTREFAFTSKTALIMGGVAISIHPKPDRATVLQAICYLEQFLRKT